MQGMGSNAGRATSSASRPSQLNTLLQDLWQQFKTAGGRARSWVLRLRRCGPEPQPRVNCPLEQPADSSAHMNRSTCPSILQREARRIADALPRAGLYGEHGIMDRRMCSRSDTVRARRPVSIVASLLPDIG